MTHQQLNSCRVNKLKQTLLKNLVKRYCMLKTRYTRELRIEGSLRVSADRHMAIDIQFNETLRKRKNARKAPEPSREVPCGDVDEQQQPVQQEAPEERRRRRVAHHAGRQRSQAVQDHSGSNSLRRP